MKEKCFFKSTDMVPSMVVRRCVARSSRNCCEEVTGGTSLCTMKPPQWHDATAFTPRTTRPTNARIPRVQCRGRHPRGRRQG